jgi:SAM-dependent methyltransferase
MTPDEPPSLADLPPEEKARRASSFGEVAGDYKRYRPGPPSGAVSWLLPEGAKRVVDLGAGTGALTRLLVGTVDEVVAVEPDDRMRAVLATEVPGATALAGRAEAMPVADAWADAVVASSSWHWVDPLPALQEMGRVIRPGGVLGAVWSGPDPEGAFLAEAKRLLAGQRARGGGEGMADLILDADRPLPTLEIHAGTSFDQPDHEVFTWSQALTADELIGLLRTLSWIITLDADRRERVLDEGRRLLRDLLGVEGDVTVDLEFRADAWRAHRHG